MCATNIYVLFSLIYFQVRTLFVSGLPMDAKPRELYLLFRAYEVSGEFILIYSKITYSYTKKLNLKMCFCKKLKKKFCFSKR